MATLNTLSSHICHFAGVDGCFIKLSIGQQILAATGRDGNNNIYPIAFGVVDKEDKDSWTWFLTQLKDALDGESGKFGYYTIISDRQKVNFSSHIYIVLSDIMCTLLCEQFNWPNI